MRKLAFFVEGQTEALFVWKLLEKIAGGRYLTVEHKRASGGRKVIRTFRLVKRSEDIGQEYFVLIVDCGADRRVMSDIRDQYDGLAQSGYEAIVGIRDVYPVSYEDILRLRRGLAFGLRESPIEVVLALAVMEIEAWFIREYTHFARISPELTLERIIEEVGFNPSQDNVELRPHPSHDLDAIYRLVGFTYDKSGENVARTVEALDYARLYLELRREIEDLGRVFDCIDGFLSSGN